VSAATDEQHPADDAGGHGTRPHEQELRRRGRERDRAGERGARGGGGRLQPRPEREDLRSEPFGCVVLARREQGRP
jgi:hypothetical protein